MFDTQLTKDQIVRETPKAYLFQVVTRENGGGQLYSRDSVREFWFPRSQVTWVRSVFGETAHVPGWLAQKAFS